MKWLPFLLIIMLGCYSCADRQRTKPASVKSDNPENTLLPKQPGKGNANNNDTVRFPYSMDPFADSGYYRGYISDTISSFEFDNDTSMLALTLKRMIRTDELKLEGRLTLSHTVLIDQRKKLRTDAYQAGDIIIKSVCDFHADEKATQTIYLNGRIIYTANDNEQDLLSIDERSFRYFSFRGNKFCVMKAGSIYPVGSAHTLRYYLVYNFKHKQLSSFMSCRFYHNLLGDVNHDDALDFVEFDNPDFCTGVPSSDNFICRLYSCNTNGKFELQQDKKGKAYFIKARSGQDLAQDSFIVGSSYWPVPVK